MKLVVQRVLNASVTVNNKVISKIDNGLLVYLGISKDDNINTSTKYIKKLVNLRIFEDEFGKLNKSLKDINGEILLVSQFTLYGNVKKGNRPSFTEALNGDEALLIYEDFTKRLSELVNVKTGEFGADMKISSINDGPVTIILEDLN